MKVLETSITEKNKSTFFAQNGVPIRNQYVAQKRLSDRESMKHVSAVDGLTCLIRIVTNL